MSAKADLLETQFRLNMARINGLVQLLFSHDVLKPTTVFGSSSGARADILRAIVVFLHATFEVALRSHIPKPGSSLSFYSRTDLDKALKLCGIDATHFRFLYPPLTQMAKRRHRIVHEADLSGTRRPLSHHRAYGSVHGGSSQLEDKQRGDQDIVEVLLRVWFYAINSGI